VESREKMFKSWQAEVQKRRQQEAAQTREDAQDAIVEVPLLPKMARDQFDINIQLSTELERLPGKKQSWQENMQVIIPV
jgi:hypothetical protein